MGKAIRALGALLASGAATAATALPTAQDHRGNRIEPFPQIDLRVRYPPRKQRKPIRSCTADRKWCAWLSRDPPEREWALHIVARGPGKTRRYRYELPMEECCTGPGRSFTIWDEIVREPRGWALIGLVFGRETGDRRSHWSYQRRLHLLRVPKESGGTPAPVLEVPLSAVVDEPVCLSAQDQRDRPWDCTDHYYLSTLFTLLPSVGPVEPANLIMVVESKSWPGLRNRDRGPVLRAPAERTGDDQVRDPACTFTRSYYFDKALGRYLPDAPLPECRSYLTP